eukprot:2651547-Amphidinium_carterae.1
METFMVKYMQFSAGFVTTRVQANAEAFRIAQTSSQEAHAVIIPPLLIFGPSVDIQTAAQILKSLCLTYLRQSTRCDSSLLRGFRTYAMSLRGQGECSVAAEEAQPVAGSSLLRVSAPPTRLKPPIGAATRAPHSSHC